MLVFALTIQMIYYPNMLLDALFADKSICFF